MGKVWKEWGGETMGGYWADEEEAPVKPETGMDLSSVFGAYTIPITISDSNAQTLYRALAIDNAQGNSNAVNTLAKAFGISPEEVMTSTELWNSPQMNEYAAKRVEIGNQENMIADLLQGAAWVGGGALGINSLLGNGVSGLLSELGGGVSDATLAAGDSMAGLVSPADLSSMGVSTTGTGAGTLAADFGGFDGVTAADLSTGTNSVVDTATNTAANVATGGGTDVGIWDDTLFDGISSGGSTTLDLGNLAAQDFADFGVTGVEALGDSLNYATTASDLTNGISWQSQLADVFRGMGLETNTALQLASSFSGDTGKNILTSLLKGNSGTTTGSGGNLLSTILSGLTGIYASQNKAQDLTEAAKYLTENSNPYRSYIKDGTVGGDGSVTSFMKGFQTPANNMATAAGSYNDLLKTSYTDPLSIWNSPEMQGLNNIFKQQIDRRDSAAGRNSQYGARAVEMQNNFLANSLPKYRSGLNDALNTSATAASNFGKVATPPGTGETSQNVGSLLTGAADSGNNYAGAVGSMLDQIFNK